MTDRLQGDRERHLEPVIREADEPSRLVQREGPRMRCRDIYLKIEQILGYNPVQPDDAEHGRHGRDCMRGHGHENGRVPDAEMERRRLDALVYREYLDSAYTVPRTDPIVSSDINEPRWERRVPGTVIYAHPTERLRIHVLNADVDPHSLHVHGLEYGIDSDGSWPFGVAAADGRRSDAICPGEEWSYLFDVTPKTVGAWPFHDHVMGIEQAVDRGLFGGIVVRDPSPQPADYEVPLFLHKMLGTGGEPAFESGLMNPGDSFAHVFADPGTFEYVCRLHPMLGRVRVNATGPATANVQILDTPTSRFFPDDVSIAVGGTVNWMHSGTTPHTVSDARTAPLASMTLNGRAFVGNTPTIVAETGKRIRWYVFNLDFGERWHNFHPHGQRFRVGTEVHDARSIGPAESFVVDTEVPPVVLLPVGCDRHGHEGKEKEHREHPDNGQHGGKKTRHCLRGDFLVHCHVEMHMMEGMAAVVRAIQVVNLDEDEVAELGYELPIADEAYCRVLGHGHGSGNGHGNGGGAGHGHADEANDKGHGHPAAAGLPGPLRLPGHGHGHGAGPDDCPDVDPHPCHPQGPGSWEQLPDLDLFVVHAAVLHTGQVLLWSGTAEVGDPLESRLWDPATDARTTQSYGEDLFCSGHAFLPDGRLCVAGGAPGGSMDSTHIFDPATSAWSKVSDMHQARWYPTVLTLPDGRILAASGTGANEIEVFDPAAGPGGTWTIVAGATRIFPELYPSLHLLPSGQVFYSRCGWAASDPAVVGTASLALSLAGAPTGSWSALGQQQFHDRQEGTAVLDIDTTVTPPAARVWVIGGGAYGPPATRNPQSVETIDLTTPGGGTAWETPPLTMNFARTNVNAVLLPDGNVFIVGGQRAGKWAADPQPVLEAEIFDPVAGSFTVTPPMGFPRQYHSVAALLPDGRVLCAGGVDPSNAVERDLRQMEVFSPGYLDTGSRPAVSGAPTNAAYGATVTVNTPDAPSISSVVLIRPNSATHHTDAGHRRIRLPITGTAASSVDVTMPADAQIAPPGWYMLFVVDGVRVPSPAHWIQVS
jgi:FtsP/CotA-like multicopper oxidase with cupredoxin domain